MTNKIFFTVILQVCKSAISDDALRTYFRYMKEWESQRTNGEKGISDNYKSIEWTKVRVAALHDLYEVAPLGRLLLNSCFDYCY